MGFHFEIAGAQIDGARDYQEDAFLITHLGDQQNGASMCIVADGMGGHAAGNVASNMAVQAFNRLLSANFPSPDLPSLLREAARKANSAIGETVRETPALKGMGCTLVSAIVHDKYLRWVSIGDSNLYLVRDGGIKKKNADHSYGGFLDRMSAEGKVIEPEVGFSRNMLMSALTGDDIADIDCPQTPLELQYADRIIVASDGLDTLTDDKLLALSREHKSPKEFVDAMLKAVTAAQLPRQDNTTVIVIDVRPSQTAATAPKPEPITLAELDTDKTDPKARANAAAAAVGAPKTETRDVPRKSAPPVAAIIVGLALAGAAAYFVFAPQKPAPAPVVLEPEPAPPVAEPTPTPTPVVPEPVAETKPEPKPEPTPEPIATPTPAPDTPTPVAPTGEAFRDPLRGGGQGPAMVWTPGGSYTMGSNPLAVDADEKPARVVNVKKFAIGVHEVTVAEYQRFARATGRRVAPALAASKDEQPVHSVSWDDALAYTKWLSAQTGKTYRLPTEAEWEYAARAGTDTPYWWGRETSGHAHCFGCESGLDPRQPTKVGTFKPNKFGLFDTAGNVAEWVHDCYHPSYEGAPTDGGVWEGGDCSLRIVRGGSFANAAKSIRSAKRDKLRGSSSSDSVGFRVVREP